MLKRINTNISAIFQVVNVVVLVSKPKHTGKLVLRVLWSWSVFTGMVDVVALV
jgi:hypothetical protein